MGELMWSAREGGTNRADVCSRAMEENRSKAQTAMG